MSRCLSFFTKSEIRCLPYKVIIILPHFHVVKEYKIHSSLKYHKRLIAFLQVYKIKLSKFACLFVGRVTGLSPITADVSVPDGPDSSSGCGVLNVDLN